MATQTWTVTRNDPSSSTIPANSTAEYAGEAPPQPSAEGGGSGSAATYPTPVTLYGRNVLTFTGDVAVQPGRLSNGIAEAVVKVGGNSIYGRLVGVGTPITTVLTQPLTIEQETISVGDLEGSIIELPEVPFEIQIAQERMTVTEGDAANQDWIVDRFQLDQNETATSLAYTYPIDTPVLILRTLPFAFVQVQPVSAGTFVDKEDGIVGNVEGASLTNPGALIIKEILGDEAVTGEENSYVGASTVTPAYDLNGNYNYSDGRQIVRLTKSTVGNYYEIEPVRAPLRVRLKGSLASTVATVLGGYISASGMGSIGDGEPEAQNAIGISGTEALINVASNEDFPPTTPFWVEVDTSIRREVMKVFNRTEDTSWEVLRGMAGTNAVAHEPGVTVKLLNPSYSWIEQGQTIEGIQVDSPYGLVSEADTETEGAQPAYCTNPIANPFSPLTSGDPYVVLYPGPEAGAPPYWVFDWQTPIFNAGYSDAGLVSTSAQVYQGTKWASGWTVYSPDWNPTGFVLFGGTPTGKYVNFDVTSNPSQMTVSGNVSIYQFQATVETTVGFIAIISPAFGEKVGYRATLQSAYQDIPSGSYGGLTGDYTRAAADKTTAIVRIRVVGGVVDTVETGTVEASWGNGNLPAVIPPA